MREYTVQYWGGNTKARQVRDNRTHKVSRDNVLCGESGVANRSEGCKQVTNGTRIRHVSGVQ